jgi:hypothetical protein
MTNPLFHFRNEFDAVLVVLHDESEQSVGPFTVSRTFEDPAIGCDDDNETHSFATLPEARAKFLELVNGEIDAVLAES